MIAVLPLRLYEQRAFRGIVAARLFDIDVLAGLQARDGHRRVPVVGGGDGDGVNFLQLKNCSKVLARGRRFAHLTFCFPGELLEDIRVHIANMRNARGALVGLQRGKMRICAAVKTDDCEIQPVVGTENPTIALGRGCKGQTCCACCESVKEFTPCNQCFSPLRHYLLHSD